MILRIRKISCVYTKETLLSNIRCIKIRNFKLEARYCNTVLKHTKQQVGE